MNFNENKLPSSMKDLEWQWKQAAQEKISFTEINIHGRQTNFNLPVDYFDMTANAANKFAFIVCIMGLKPSPLGETFR